MIHTALDLIVYPIAFAAIACFTLAMFRSRKDMSDNFPDGDWPQLPNHFTTRKD